MMPDDKTPAMKRLFIAVAIPLAIKDVLGKISLDLKKTGADAKWVEIQNIHLTMKFLGSVAEEKTSEIVKRMKKACRGKSHISVTLDAFGGFPSLHAPRVLWAGLKDPENHLAKIASILENDLEELGFSKESRPFQTHITLARIRSQQNRLALVQAVTDLQKIQKPIPFTIDNLTLFESHLSPKGPTYVVLDEVKLKNNN